MTLDIILERLNEHHQRATYAAVARALGTSERSLMSDRPKNPLHSWVVAKNTGEPTGYTPRQKHPQPHARSTVLTNESDLIAWLRNPR